MGNARLQSAAMEPPLLTRVLAEFLGTGTLVFCGTGAIAANELFGGALGHAGIALTFGLVVMVLVYTLQGVSGAHLNPAVTVTLTVLDRKQRYNWTVPGAYVLAQLCGGLAASILLLALVGEGTSLGATQPFVRPWRACVLEGLLTAFLMLVICACGQNRGIASSKSGLVIGGVVGMEAMFAGPLTGASMNPARSIGPAVVGGDIDHLWLYIVGPLTGAIVGGVCAMGFWPRNDQGASGVVRSESK